MSHSESVNRCVETLCLAGCDGVRSVIRALEQGEVVAEAAALSMVERQQVLAELKAIMAVYDRTS